MTEIPHLLDVGQFQPCEISLRYRGIYAYNGSGDRLLLRLLISCTPIFRLLSLLLISRRWKRKYLKSADAGSLAEVATGIKAPCRLFPHLFSQFHNNVSVDVNAIDFCWNSVKNGRIQNPAAVWSLFGFIPHRLLCFPRGERLPPRGLYSLCYTRPP
jgi:hypothetical protein